MRDTATKLTAFTAIISAAGFLIHWLQNLQIYEEETGLARSGMAISWITAILIVLFAAWFWFIVIRLKKADAPTDPSAALGGSSFLYTAVCAAVILLFAVSGLLQLLSANAENYAADQIILRRIQGVLVICSAIALIFLMVQLNNENRAGLRRVCMVVLILFSGIWLSATYKSAASDPVLWRSAVEILAVCSVMLALYYVAGYFFGEPNPWSSIYFCNLGAFLCVMSAIDDHTGAENLCFAATAVLLLVWSYSMIANLKPQQETISETA